ncbi:MAG: hypothetical protein GYB33_18970 [Gammaproteobacteria bacterium]|uniref:hypothetical protein n=1 Tax=Pseudomaricurvus alcaniphilus TaxID=1166482 RepID=UPI00140E642C|nr:hypothetical protein [Pseudomaricurvus alcaniphilus]MBR9912428.1 hypothetical protein [Gammaproteobacteria bacterium]NHN36739.1 hypothetical protein [Pseudomaricurvus alcaniphilus]
MKKVLITTFFFWLSAVVQAAPVALTSSIQCSAGNQQNGIAIGDVTGNLGGATDCWGTYDGNDPGPSGDGFSIGTDTYAFLAKQDTPGGLSGTNIGLVVSPSGGAPSGTWEFDPTKFSGQNFLIVLKAASKPGYAVWLFSGADAASYSGTWLVAWGKNLSHLSIYHSGPTFGNEVPVLPTLWLLGVGLVAVLISRRKR